LLPIPAIKFIVSLINNVVPEPYMDEIFHISQTRKYCNGDFSWNPMITTPPALYLLSLPFFCNKERFFNSMLYSLAKKLFIESKFETVLTSFTIITLPVLFQSTTLFYTDLLSLVSVFLAFSSKQTSATVFFAIALLTRQTNIVWVLFYLGVQGVTSFNFKKPFYSAFELLRKNILILVLIFSSVYYVIFYNDAKIVLGDHKAHKPVLHLPQLAYFMVFCTASSVPIVIENFSKTFSFIKRYWFTAIALNIAFLIAVHQFTYAHPYLLADNRHYTFYIWRKIIMRNQNMKYYLTPIYVYCTMFVLSMVKKISVLIVLGAFVSTALCIVPAGLLEFRYFIIPYILWRISFRTKNKITLIAELLLTALINVFVIYMFLKKPFVWPSEPNQLQRFMW
uniref:Dolichyl-P-Glc:Glc2Man9GlcNAc2-PP-dolichol alpha-1,2-glucosyltransferase n=1 Tax=Rhabditophanes sp. KR3021 TaxID=114890 RepID=A0AC35UAV1_9BILA